MEPTPESGRRPAEGVVRRLREEGHEAWFAGGCVRDTLLGISPKDFDVATSARPADVHALFPKVVPVGERFGVVLVVEEGTAVEVATFRRDAVYEDGRRPVAVEFADRPEEDAVRRDFTVNGLFLDPVTGEVLDFVGGRRDVGSRLVRAIGDPGERFDEDRLRMLRAVRLAATLGFELERGTFFAVRARAAEIRQVSAERIREELFRILAAPGARRGLELLLVSGLLEAFLPEVARMVGVPQPPRFHPEGDVWTHTLVALSRVRSASPVVRLAALLHDVGKPETMRTSDRVRFHEHAAVGETMSREIGRRLRLSRLETERIADVVRSHLRFMDVRRMREAKLRRFLSSEWIEDHLEVHRADCLGSHGDLSQYDFCLARRESYEREPVPPARLLTGRDLIRLGLDPGPEFARILGEVEDLTLEGTLRTREDALDWARSRFGTGGGNRNA